MCLILLFLSHVVASQSSARPPTVRLNTAFSDNDYTGVVELWSEADGNWGGVCTLFVTDEVARVVCQILGHANGVIDRRNSDVLDVSYWDKIVCGYSNTTLDDCLLQQSDVGECKPGSQLAVVCGELKNCTFHEFEQFYRENCSLGGREVFKCWNSSVIYTYEMEQAFCSFGNICPAMSSNYQGCGCPGVEVSNGTCHTIICRYFPEPRLMIAVETSIKCDGYYDCEGKEDEDLAECADPSFLQCEPTDPVLQSGYIPPRYQCDSQADCVDGRDESNGCEHGLGLNCMILGEAGWVDKFQLCDGTNDCDSGSDEVECEWHNEVDKSCPSRKTLTQITILNRMVCKYPNMSFVDGDCHGYLDQLNCSDTHSFLCTVTIDPVEGQEVTVFPNTRVRNHWVCNNHYFCSDKSDEWCFRLSGSCYVHKHQLCDGYDDCQNREDELMPICDKMTPTKTCLRRYTKDANEMMHIPVMWLCDGEVDCIGGLDEDLSEWNVCGSGEERRCYPNTQEFACQEGFICPDKSNTYVSMEQLCNHDESCGGAEEEFCQITKEVSKVGGYIYNIGRSKYIPPCLPGLLDQFHCGEMVHQSMTRLASTDRIFAQSIKKSCKNVYGEQYALMLCEGLCAERSKSDCPLQKVSDTQCIGTNMAYVPDDDNRVQKLIKMDDGRYDEEIFVCKNSNCLSKSKLCDLVDDCGDGSDEEDCANLFQCKTGSPKYIRINQRCNAVHDCADHSDECDGCSPEEIINGAFLKTCTFLMGSCSVLVNIYMVVGIIRENKIFNSRAQFINLSMVLLISLGDFCLGIYLMNVFIVDMVYSERYCEVKYTWLTSGHCAALGVISTFGTELSIFTMTCLSMYRAISLKSVMGRARITSRHKFVMCCLAASLVVLSLFMAMIPISNWTEDYFTNGMFYESNSLFNKITDLKVHKDFLNAYERIASKNESFTKDDYTWHEVRQLLKEKIFKYNKTSHEEIVIGSSLKFYGNDGVCLFKYFVSPTDPQRIFSLSMLGTNLICFTIISITYSLVIYTAHGSASSTTTRAKDRRSAQLQTKITLMIVTNILSWVPFGIICLLHTINQIDATPYYKISSVILLPINSCVNPIIYTNIVGDGVAWFKAKVSGRASIRLGKLRDRLEMSFVSTTARDLRLTYMRPCECDGKTVISPPTVNTPDHTKV